MSAKINIKKKKHKPITKKKKKKNAIATVPLEQTNGTVATVQNLGKKMAHYTKGAL